MWLLVVVDFCFCRALLLALLLTNLKNVSIMWGAIIGAGLSAAGSIFGGMASARANRRAQEDLNRRKMENEARYDRMYNEDVTQRADAQALLSRVEDSIRRRNQAAVGRSAVMGGSGADVAAAKEANNEALSHAVSEIASRGDARKERAEEQYLSRKDALSAEQSGVDARRAQSRSGAVSGLLQAAGGLASSVVGGKDDDDEE